MPKITVPTIGRVVYIYLGDNAKPYAGIVADVQVNGADLDINAMVISRDGSGGSVQNIPHSSERDKGKTYWHWDWMDYQKGQAAKTEALEKELDKVIGKVDAEG